MATSGSFATLDIAQIVEEAFERGQGKDIQTLNAGHMRTARRSLQMIFSEWENRHVKVWALDEVTFTTAAGDATQAIEPNSVDVLDAYIRDGSADVMLTKIGREDYVALPSKSSEGKPDRYWIDRAAEPFVMTLYPVPDVSTYTVTYWRVRRLYDVTASAETPDVPFRWVAALTARLALELFGKLPFPERSPTVFQMLKAASDEAYYLASTEDRDRAPTSVIPAYWGF